MSEFTYLSKTEHKKYDSIFFKHNDLIFKQQTTPKKVISYIIYCIKSHNYKIDFTKLDWKHAKNPEGSFFETGFYKNHKKYIDDDGVIRPEYSKKIQFYYQEIEKCQRLQLLEDVHQEVVVDAETGETGFIEVNDIRQIKPNVFEILPHHTMKDINDAFFISKGDCSFQYNFDDRMNRLPLGLPDVTINSLQKFMIVIKTKLNSYAEYARLQYYCTICDSNHYVNPNDVESTKQKYTCTGANPETGKQCKKILVQPTTQSDMVKMNTYDALYFDADNDNKPIPIMVLSSLELKSYEYLCVGLVLHNNGDPYILILDTKQIPKYKIKPGKYSKDMKPLGEDSYDWCMNNITRYSIKEYDNSVNILNAIDEEIEKLSGDKILGMHDVKFAYLCQRMFDYFNFKHKIGNIALVGEADVGKTYTINRYGYFLFGARYKVSAGNSISMPSLRGSARSNMDIKKGNKNRMGMLGIYGSICIDEIKENKNDLFDDLKPVLLEPTFSNDTADGDKIQYRKTAQVVATENPLQMHLKDYYKRIKQEYEDISDGNNEMEVFNLSWDLYLHIYEYGFNPELQRAIVKTRGFFADKGQHWIDGEQLATHDRFPFYFYIKMGTGSCVAERGSAAVDSVVYDNEENTDLLGYQLMTDNINDIFEQFREYYVKKPSKDDVKVLKEKINEFIDEFCLKKKSRLFTICTMIGEVSRTLNKRSNYTWIDYMRIRRYLWCLDRGTSIDEMEYYWFIPNIEQNELDISNETFGDSYEDI